MRLQTLLRGTLAVAALTGCMTEPANGDTVASTSTSVRFAGFVTDRRGEVEIQASSNPTGPFEGWDGSTAVALRTPSATLDDTSYFAWQLSSAIPLDRWNATCGSATTYVRARSGNFSVLTFEVDGWSCFLERFLQGDLAAAVSECRSPDSPIVQLTAPPRTEVIGDVTITTVEQAAALECVRRIRGNLTYDPAEPLRVSLPSLVEVTGDVEIRLPSEDLPQGDVLNESRCDGVPQTHYTAISRFDVPALATIGGELRIVNQHTPAGSLSYVSNLELGLSALTNLRGNLSVVIDTYANVCGLESLTLVRESVLIDGSPGDDGFHGFPINLTTVEGDFRVVGGHTSSEIGRSLRRVGGTVEVAELYQPRDFFPQLEHAGELLVRDMLAWSDPARIGADGVRLDALTLLRNENLSSLGGPTGSVWILEPDAELTIGQAADENPLLSDAAVCDFVAFQEGQGWTGAGAFACP